MSQSSHLPLEPIEKASIDELRSLQLKRLKSTLQHAYDNSPVYKAKFDKAGVRFARQLSLWHVCGATL